MLQNHSFSHTPQIGSMTAKIEMQGLRKNLLLGRTMEKINNIADISYGLKKVSYEIC